MNPVKAFIKTFLYHLRGEIYATCPACGGLVVVDLKRSLVFHSCAANVVKTKEVDEWAEYLDYERRN